MGKRQKRDDKSRKGTGLGDSVAEKHPPAPLPYTVGHLVGTVAHHKVERREFFFESPS